MIVLLGVICSLHLWITQLSACAFGPLGEGEDLSSRKADLSNFEPPWGTSNPYELLGLPETTSLEDVKYRYGRLSLKYRADFGDKRDHTEKFKKLTAAIDLIESGNYRPQHSRPSDSSARQNTRPEPQAGPAQSQREQAHTSQQSAYDPHSIDPRYSTELVARLLNTFKSRIDYLNEYDGRQLLSQFQVFFNSQARPLTIEINFMGHIQHAPLGNVIVGPHKTVLHYLWTYQESVIRRTQNRGLVVLNEIMSAAKKFENGVISESELVASLMGVD